MKKNTKNLLLAAGAVFVAKKVGLFGDDDTPVNGTNYRKENIDGVNMWRVESDYYGNPRYVFHFLELDSDYNKAHKKALSIGASKYRAKWFGGGFVIQSYNPKGTAKRIKALRKK